jgi:hypothetical protein
VEQEFFKKEIRISKQGVETIDFQLNFNIKAEDILFYEIVKHDSSYWIGSIIVFEMNALGKIIHYIPKHSLKIWVWFKR